MKHVQEFENFINEGLKVISEDKVGNVTVKKVENGWLLVVPSQTGKGMNTVAFTDEQIPALLKILTR